VVVVVDAADRLLIYLLSGYGLDCLCRPVGLCPQNQVLYIGLGLDFVNLLACLKLRFGRERLGCRVGMLYLLGGIASQRVEGFSDLLLPFAASVLILAAMASDCFPT